MALALGVANLNITWPLLPTSLSFSLTDILERIRPLIWPSLLALSLYAFFFVPIGSPVPAPSSPYDGSADGKKKWKQGLSLPPRPKDGSVKVVEIYVHPIKSCRGTSLQESRYTSEGLENDRKFCIVDAKSNTVITARQVSKMVLITPRIVEDNLVVSFPPGSGCRSFTVPLQPPQEVLATWELLPTINLHSNLLPAFVVQSVLPHIPPSTPSTTLSTFFNRPVYLVYKGPGDRAVRPTYEFPRLDARSVFQDMYPLLVLARESVEDVEREVRERAAKGEGGVEERWEEESLNVRRFRPNVVFKGAGAWSEDDWEEIQIGSETAPRMTLVSKCTRCMLPNVCPNTGERDNVVPYKVLTKFRTGKDPEKPKLPCVGCNAVVDNEGIVRVGDVVYVTKMLGEGEARVPWAESEEETELGKEKEVFVNGT